MADPRMSQNAARLSEDIGDVLTAIRRMIADDDALSSARDRIRAERSGLVQDDAGDFLARRYGGNAALARQMVAQAARPAPAPTPAELVPAELAPAPAIPQFITRARPEVVADAQPASVTPLRLEAERRVDEPEAPKLSGWRAWLRPEPREAAAVVHAEPVAEPAPAPVAARVQDSGDDDDFAEAFDWKARMRPELDEPEAVALTQPKLAEHRLSGWALPPEPAAIDTVALLAAEVEAFDAELAAQNISAEAEQIAAAEAEDQAIRELLREMVQEELNGELGERFSANLRALIRREVAAAVEQQLDRF